MAGDHFDFTATGSAVGVFAIVLWLVKVIVARSGITEADSRLALLNLERRLLAQMEQAVKDSEANCEIKLEAMRHHLNIVAHGLEMIAAQYPDNTSLALLMTTLKEKDL